MTDTTAPTAAPRGLPLLLRKQPERTHVPSLPPPPRHRRRPSGETLRVGLERDMAEVKRAVAELRRRTQVDAIKRAGQIVRTQMRWRRALGAPSRNAPVLLASRVPRRTATCSGRPAAQRSRRSATARDGDGEPAALARFARATGLRLDQVRVCGRCQIAAYAVDDYQRQALDRAGFVAGRCPRCWGVA